MNSIPSNKSSPPHVVLFPFMSKGHTIPLLHFACFLLRRGMAVTVVTTSANRPFVAQSLQDTTSSIVDLPFPNNIADIPDGVESTDKLPSMSLFYKFATATVLMQPDFERIFETLPRVSFMVSDAFLWWTLESATKFNVPRFVYNGMSCYAMVLCFEFFRQPREPGEDVVSLTSFPWIKLSKNVFHTSFVNPDPKSLEFEFHMNMFSTTARSYGLIINSFYELEPVFADHMNKNRTISKSCWCVGPFCLADQKKHQNYSETEKKPIWIQWLDRRLEEKLSVLYVAFGSQAEISDEQIKEIANALEGSMVNFLWVLRKKEWEKIFPDGFEGRVRNRGMVVREWVDQREILMHESVLGFLSHCGWNSVLESVSTGVPILAWPMMAEQPLNAKMVEEEIKVGLRVETCDGPAKGLVKADGLKKMVRELMEGEKGKVARKKAEELAVMAKKSVEEGGSSWRSLELLIEETCTAKGI